MKILIVTQAVDLDDPVLGFFHAWVCEFATKYEHVSVVCLKEGRHALPSNVRVYSLGKESGPSRAKYVTRFYKYIWMLRKESDAVFVHMNQEYVLLGGIFWRFFGKHIVLWRNHKKGSFLTRIACGIATTVCYTSPMAYVAGYRNALQMPVGIDTTIFVPPREYPSPRSLLFLGRIDEVKKPLAFVSSLKQLVQREVDFHADIYGESTYAGDPFFASFLEAVKPLVESGHVTLFPAVANAQTPAIYAGHAIYVNLTPSGSFDKTIGEAMACGCIVIVANEVLRGIVPSEFIVNPDDIGAVTASIAYALGMDVSVARSVSTKLHQYIVHDHSISLLVQKMSELFIKNKKRILL